MPGVTLEQALRNAIEAEQGSARFYDRLRARTHDPAAQLFLARMVEVEHTHAAAVERLARNLDVELPAHADRFASAVETAPGWDFVEDLDLREALEAALESEQSACLYYETLADAFPGHAGEVFLRLAADEAHHAELLRAEVGRLARPGSRQLRHAGRI